MRSVPAVLEDAGADTLMEALHALGCEPRAEPQRPARSLRWSRASPDPCPRGVSVPGVGAECSPGLGVSRVRAALRGTFPRAVNLEWGSRRRLYKAGT